MKSKRNRLLIFDYTTIILAFLTLILSIIIFYTFSYRDESNIYLAMMIINFIFIIIGFKNLNNDRKKGYN